MRCKKSKIIAAFVSMVLVLSNVGVLGNIKSVKASDIPIIKYSAHVQDIGWQDYVQNGEVAGTVGKSKRIEAIKITTDNENLGVNYSTHVQNVGWTDYVTKDKESGTVGENKRVEAIAITLTGTEAANYDIYYRVHVQNLGWLGWAKNGENAGTCGYEYRIEGIQIKLTAKGGEAPGDTSNEFKEKSVSIQYRTHVQDVGWQSYVKNGAMSGTSGRSKRLEGININLVNPKYLGNIEYSTHVQDIGWQDFVKNGELAGTTGQSKRLEAIKIRLTGKLANEYDVYYRVHVQNIGWLGWAKNGEPSGSEGYKYRLEAIEIKTVEKGGAAPGSTNNTFYKKDGSSIVTPSEPEKPKDIGEPDGSYYAPTPSSNYFNIYTLDELDLDELLGNDQVYAVEGNMITTPNDVGKKAYGVGMDKVSKNGMYFNRTLSYGLTLNMRNGKYVDYDKTGYIYNYVNLLCSGEIEYGDLSSQARDNEYNYRYYDKEGRALNVKIVMNMYSYETFDTADLSELTRKLKRTYLVEDMYPEEYDSDLSEEVFLVFYDEERQQNGVGKYRILYQWVNE